MDTLFKSFGIEGSLLFWQVINFGLLFAILWHLLYKPLGRLMNEREKKIKASLTEAESLAKKSSALEKEFKEKMTAQKAELEALYRKTLSEQEKIKKELKIQASKDAEKILAEAKIFAAEERAAVMKSVESEVKELALAIASKIIEKELDEKTQKKLMEETLKSLKTNR